MRMLPLWLMDYSRFTLANGLRVIHHKIPGSNTVTLNILYNVGARDEAPYRTGFAHLFEHLMFGGSINIPDYDKVVEWAGGNNNAYTNNDYTNYYVNVPLENAETAFWLESDRMLGLDFSEERLNIQKGVVIEEFKQRCNNAPFGMLWHHLRGLAYRVHPYRWPTIGLETEHVASASLDDVRAFYTQHYHPNNAILCVGGPMEEARVQDMAEKWFGSIDREGARNLNVYQNEPEQDGRRFLETDDLLPQKAVFLAFRTPSVLENDWPIASLFAELLGGTETAPLYLELVKKQRVFTSAESFYMKGLSEGMFVVYGLLHEDCSHELAEKAIRELLNQYSTVSFSDARIARIKKQLSTRLLFEYTNPMNRVQKLCYFENIDCVEQCYKQEVGMLERVTSDELLSWAQCYLSESKSNVVYYRPKQ